MRLRRKKRIRAKIRGSKERPRLSIFRSLKHIYSQLIDDDKGETLLSASDFELLVKSKIKNQKSKIPKKKKEIKEKIGKIEISKEVGKLIAKKALEKKIKKIVFDRSGYKYHGRIKALAEGAREGGLIF